MEPGLTDTRPLSYKVRNGLEPAGRDRQNPAKSGHHHSMLGRLYFIFTAGMLERRYLIKNLFTYAGLIPASKFTKRFGLAGLTK
jgi:hypothetical protein